MQAREELLGRLPGDAGGSGLGEFGALVLVQAGHDVVDNEGEGG